MIDAPSFDAPMPDPHLIQVQELAFDEVIILGGEQLLPGFDPELMAANDAYPAD
ncbi:MAG: hypothetical protein K0U93_03345 [Gammaproteobacteria bacterium]|nr:hypothetical protein [Gammaproteobacteria bacterium]